MNGGRIPETRPSCTWKKATGCGTLYVIITEVDGEIKDIFCNLGKGGSCQLAWTQAVARIISKAVFDYHMPVEEVIKQLRGIECPKQLPFPKPAVKSCVDALAQVLQKHLEAKKGNISEKV